jgi:hypothetical protein
VAVVAPLQSAVVVVVVAPGVRKVLAVPEALAARLRAVQAVPDLSMRVRAVQVATPDLRASTEQLRAVAVVVQGPVPLRAP